MTGSFARPYISIAQVLTAVLQVAADHHRSGRRAAAAALYHEVLTLDPRHADALFLLGVLERQEGRLEIAAQYLREATRWAADRTRTDTELALVEELLRRTARKPAASWPVFSMTARDGGAVAAQA